MRIRVYLHSGYADACPVADSGLEFDTNAHADLDADTNTDFDVDADIEFPERQPPRGCSTQAPPTQIIKTIH